MYRWCQVIPYISQVILGGFRSFRWFHIDYRFGKYTERLNVALDLMCKFLCKKLFHISFCVKLQFILIINISKILNKGFFERFLYICRRLYSHLYESILQVLHPTCKKISSFRNVRDLHCPRTLLIVFHCTKNEEILNGKHHFLSSFYCIIFLLIAFHFVSFLNNSENKGFHHQTFFRLYKVYFRKHFSMPFFSNPWPKYTPS